MAGVDVTTWQRGYTNRNNKLNTSSNTGNKIVNEGATGSKLDNPGQSYKYLINTGNTPRDYGYSEPVTPKPNNYGNPGSSLGGGGVGYSAPAVEQPDYSAWFNALTDINNQKYEALRKELARQKQMADDSANANYARNLREWRKMYADKRNGQGLSNRLNIGYNRDSALASNREAFDTNNLSAISGRYSDLANLTSYLPNMDSATIKKIMANVSGWK